MWPVVFLQYTSLTRRDPNPPTLLPSGILTLPLWPTFCPQNHFMMPLHWLPTRRGSAVITRRCENHGAITEHMAGCAGVGGG